MLPTGTTRRSEIMGFMTLACLVDVYGTILTCDFAPFRRELPALAGVEEAVWTDAYYRSAPPQEVGHLSREEVYEIVLRTCGVRPRDGLVRRLVDLDRELLLANTTVFPDTLPFLELLRSRGITSVIVSNCSEHTRALLTSIGVTDAADALVLSCEVGSAKPAPLIYRRALAEAGVAAADALFVDDQAAFCAGAEVLGIGAVRIVRKGPVPASAVGSLLDVADYLR
jgi:putative hydrolase of the HAD superfamily